MPSSGPLRIGVVCEDVPDFELLATLVDRTLCEHIGWVRELLDGVGPAALGGIRAFCGIEPDRAFLKWSALWALARDKRLRAHGKFGGETGAPDAHAARMALLLFQSAESPPHAVLLLRDTDGDVERCSGLQQARTDPDRRWPFQIVLGAAHSKRECWLLSGFEPEGSHEEGELGRLREELGFDPRLHPERLTAASEREGTRRNAKQVCSRLVGGERAREQRCFEETPLARLRERGQGNGLANFLGYVEKRLIPLLARVPR